MLLSISETPTSKKRPKSFETLELQYEYLCYVYRKIIISAGGAITFQVSRFPKKIQKNAKLVSSELETVGSITTILLYEEFSQLIRSFMSCVMSPYLFN